MIDKNELSTIPNIITLTRIGSLPILYLLFFLDHFTVFAILYSLFGLTDMVDGYLARKLNLVTKTGQFLDSLADILFNVSTAFFLFTRLHELRAQYQTLLAIMIVLGIIYLVTSIVKFSKVNFIHTTLFRIAAVSIYICFLVSFFTMPVRLTQITIILLSVSLIESIIIYIIFGEVDPDVRTLREAWRRYKK